MPEFSKNNDYGYDEKVGNDFHYIEDDVDYGPMTKSEFLGALFTGLCVVITFVSILVILGSRAG